MRPTALAAAALMLLAGCSQTDSGTGASDAGVPPGTPLLSGYVLDPGIVPMKDVHVRVLDTNATATTDASGHYAFTDLPVDRVLLLVATKDGFTPLSKQVSVPTQSTVRLNFTMEPISSKTPFMQKLPQTLFIACQVATEVSGQNSTYDCSSGTGIESASRDQWEIAVGPDLAGVVLELAWTAQSPLESALSARLETLNLGQLNVILAEGVSTSPLRLTVPQATAQKYYTPGGVMKLTVRVDPNNDANEVAAGAGFAFEQQVDAFASLFYVAPPPPDYTITKA